MKLELLRKSIFSQKKIFGFNNEFELSTCIVVSGSHNYVSFSKNLFVYVYVNNFINEKYLDITKRVAKFQKRDNIV